MSPKHLPLLPLLLALPGLQAQPNDTQPAQTKPKAEASTLPVVVVTGSRAPTPLADEPQRIEVVDAATIEATPQRELVDVLKKNASVDVIQYPGQLSGVGIRGFGPQFSGLNQRTLLLVDGLPAMTDNLSTLGTGDLQRIEVLKGPASALYGSQAMGGVVNLITRRSTGPLEASLSAGLGQFSARELQGRAGGRINERLSFDYSGQWQAEGDMRMGNGQKRPHSDYNIQKHALRLGLQLAPQWQLDWRSSLYRGKDIASPGDIAYGLQNQGSKDLDRWGTRLQLQGQLGAHALSASAYTGRQTAENATVSSRYDPPGTTYPYRSYGGTLRWSGLQLQDAWQWGAGARLVLGLDADRAQSTSRRYDKSGAQLAPYSANSRRQSAGLYAQQSWEFNQGATVLNLGARHDRIRVQTLATPLLTSFTPGKANFGKASPSAGVQQRLGGGFTAHASYGEGFMTPDAFQLTGESLSVRDGRRLITRGNAALRPESSRSWDLGLGWENHAWQLDATYFDTRVRDKIVSVKAIDTPEQSLSTFANAHRARMQGVELMARWRFTPGWSLGLSGTRMLKARDQVKGQWVDANNVPRQTWRLALEGQHGPWSGLLALRHVGSRKDLDWVNPATYGQQQSYAPYSVADLSLRYQFAAQHALQLSVDNLTDKFYWEKFGFPQPGRQFKLRYIWEL
ncbi:hypothetical protein CK620_11770 [Vandammella animalimorsus]|uniref:TonB-dependent receptor n=1 Tax=Vandammella animalimorsus TaxID=2029117 RepID=A0A2A2A8A4_9BURK|nr:hypothetical protein CK620_11770 [Vandammella animalimorsus]